MFCAPSLLYACPCKLFPLSLECMLHFYENAHLFTCRMHCTSSPLQVCRLHPDCWVIMIFFWFAFHSSFFYYLAFELAIKMSVFQGQFIRDMNRPSGMKSGPCNPSSFANVATQGTQLLAMESSMLVSFIMVTLHTRAPGWLRTWQHDIVARGSQLSKTWGASLRLTSWYRSGNVARPALQLLTSKHSLGSSLFADATAIVASGGRHQA
jgi:hypothetical protein